MSDRGSQNHHHSAPLEASKGNANDNNSTSKGGVFQEVEATIVREQKCIRPESPTGKWETLTAWSCLSLHFMYVCWFYRGTAGFADRRDEPGSCSSLRPNSGEHPSSQTVFSEDCGHLFQDVLSRMWKKPFFQSVVYEMHFQTAESSRCLQWPWEETCLLVFLQFELESVNVFSFLSTPTHGLGSNGLTNRLLLSCSLECVCVLWKIWLNLTTDSSELHPANSNGEHKHSSICEHTHTLALLSLWGLSKTCYITQPLTLTSWIIPT